MMTQWVLVIVILRSVNVYPTDAIHGKDWKTFLSQALQADPGHPIDEWPIWTSANPTSLDLLDSATFLVRLSFAPESWLSKFDAAKPNKKRSNSEQDSRKKQRPS